MSIHCDVQGSICGVEDVGVSESVKEGVSFMSSEVNLKPRFLETQAQSLFHEIFQKKNSKWSVGWFVEEEKNQLVEKFLRLFPFFFFYTTNIRLGITRRSYIYLLLKLRDFCESKKHGKRIVIRGSPATGKSTFSWWVLSLFLYVNQPKQPTDPKKLDNLKGVIKVLEELKITLPQALVFKRYKENEALIVVGNKELELIQVQVNRFGAIRNLIGKDYGLTDHELTMKMWSFSEREECPCEAECMIQTQSTDIEGEMDEDFAYPTFYMPSFSREEFCKILMYSEISALKFAIPVLHVSEDDSKKNSEKNLEKDLEASLAESISSQKKDDKEEEDVSSKVDKKDDETLIIISKLREHLFVSGASLRYLCNYPTEILKTKLLHKLKRTDLGEFEFSKRFIHSFIDKSMNEQSGFGAIEAENFVLSKFIYEKWYDEFQRKEIKEKMEDLKRMRSYGPIAYGHGFEATVLSLLTKYSFNYQIYGRDCNFSISRQAKDYPVNEVIYYEGDFRTSEDEMAKFKKEEPLLIRPLSPTNPFWDFILYTEITMGNGDNKWAVLVLQCTFSPQHKPISCPIIKDLKKTLGLDLTDIPMFRVFVSPKGHVNLQGDSENSDNMHKETHYNCKVDDDTVEESFRCGKWVRNDDINTTRKRRKLDTEPSSEGNY